ncbi:MAG: hypothetical protein K9L68_07710 [Spirochaetales bacterium]|nr:hypothetical protein [Spirochaetales bacterium]MCF7938468.1 hypothetical protein [Spirochaetales bacterium]
MTIHYYVSLFPMEALIASQLEPEAFGAYMAIGSRKGSNERLIFAEINGEFGNDFDWDYAAERCVSHEDGEPKHSLYLSVYRTIEKIPLTQYRNLYLTTRDGRSLPINPTRYTGGVRKSIYIYQELSPINPLVVSSMPPEDFTDFITAESQKIHVPVLVFADLKVIDFKTPEQTGNIGGIYDRNSEHIQSCIESVEGGGKPTKTIDRSHIESFSYQAIDRGIFFGSEEEILFFPMPDYNTLRMHHYAWAKSALII